MQPKVNNQDIITRLGLEGLDEQSRNQLIEQVAQLIQTRFSLRLSEQLSEEQLAKLDGMTNSGKIEEAENAVRDMVGDYDELLSSVTEEVILEMSQSLDYLKKRTGR